MQTRYSKLSEKVRQHVAKVLESANEGGGNYTAANLTYSLRDCTPKSGAFVDVDIGTENRRIYRGYAPEDFPYGWQRLKPLRRNIQYELNALGLTLEPSI